MLPAVSLSRRLAAEAVGSALLLAAIVGSGIMGERLSGGNAGLALLANSLATGGALVALLLSFEDVHLNPLVTLISAVRRETAWREVPSYLLVQVAGAFAGVAAANAMFGLPVFFPSSHARPGSGQLLAEAVATFGLLLVVLGATRQRPFAVAAYITAAYWFTSSTCFANPAVTLARMASDTFAGIRPVDIPGFIAAQLAGAAAAAGFFSWLRRKPA
jgi:glycerol uptake facilitator-like aquaporin